VFILSACISDLILLKKGSEPNSEKVVLVGKVVLDPKINRKGKRAKNDKHLIKHKLLFTKGDGSTRNTKDLFDVRNDKLYLAR
jgi:hypothetical protein